MTEEGNPILPVSVAPSRQQAKGRHMGTPQEYLNSAAECLNLSRAINDPDSRAMLVEIAETWTKLAKYEQAKAEQESV